MIDRFAIGHKFAAADEHVRLLVIGGGRAGLAAAIAAARAGVQVTLVDENPVAAALMGMDVPLSYGQRMNAAVQEEARMVERIVAATPAIEEAFDAGVDVRLGVACWGVFANGAALGALPCRMAGLTDGTRSWMCGFDALILATGARDFVLSFPGIERPGMMGARAFAELVGRYDAFSGRRVVVLGSGELAEETSRLAEARGVEIAGVVEVLAEPVAGCHLPEGLGVFCGASGLCAEGSTDGVTALRFASCGTDQRLACDTVVLALGAVPVIELAATAGCALRWDADGSFWVAALNARGMTSVPGIFCAGKCAGQSLPGDETARYALAFLANGNPASEVWHAAEGGAGATGSAYYRLAWMRMVLQSTPPDTLVCQCEEVTRGEILGVRPPRYLGCGAGPIDARDAKTLLQDGPINPDQVKRLTRAGMGVCQGRRCREQIALMLALESGVDAGAVPLAQYRAPVRPLPLSVLADAGETADMRKDWDVWFGIRTQWVPYDAIGTPEEAALLAAGGTQHA